MYVSQFRGLGEDGMCVHMFICMWGRRLTNQRWARED